MTDRKRWLISGLSELGKQVIAVLPGVLLSLAVIASLSSAPGHDEMLEEMSTITDQLTYISCLLLIPPEERVPDEVAACQVESAP